MRHNIEGGELIVDQGILWLVLALFVGLLVVKIFLVKKGKAKKMDYKMLYNLGLVFLLLGVYEVLKYGDTTFVFLGGLYAAVGYSKRSEWKK